MRFRKSRRVIVALALAASLAGSLPAAAANGGRGRTPHGVLELADGFWAWAWHQVTTAWTKQGACIDPNGRCTPTTSTPSGSDEGACIDPNGAPCAASSESDRGMSIDPDG